MFQYLKRIVSTVHFDLSKQAEVRSYLKSFLKSHQRKNFINVTLRIRFFFKIIPYVSVNIVKLDSYLYYWIDVRCEGALHEVAQFALENEQRGKAHETMVQQHEESLTQPTHSSL